MEHFASLDFPFGIFRGWEITVQLPGECLLLGGDHLQGLCAVYEYVQISIPGRMDVVKDEDTLEHPCCREPCEVAAAIEVALPKGGLGLGQELKGCPDIFPADDFLLPGLIGIDGAVTPSPTLFIEQYLALPFCRIDYGPGNVSPAAIVPRSSHDNVFVFCNRIKIFGHFPAEFSLVPIRFDDQQQIHIAELIAITTSKGSEKYDGFRCIGLEKGLL